MYTGEKLGEAIKTAMKLKDVTQSEVADKFGVRQPSVAGWIKSGRIGKKHIDDLIEYFSDVVPPSHFGIENMVISSEPLPYRTDEGKYVLNPKNTEGQVLIEQLDIAGACGAGEPLLYEYPELLNVIGFSYEQARKLFSGRNMRNIKLVSTTSDSMTPTIPSGATVFIDVSEQRFMGDAIYLFNYQNHIYLKRLQRTPAGIIVKSDNKLYDTFPIEPEHEFHIIGRYTGIIHVEVIG
uniref:Repressor protein CI n=1 Tax=Siphoviridae sp. ctR0j7 TaxID=2823580 RepID=A0A8S5LHI5_9CAUD|nr:MAG TPA: repressor protein CI [Siphoviridae sp. ctR0j7]